MTSPSFIQQVSVKLQGREVPPATLDAVEEVTVHCSAHPPDLATLQFADHDLKLIDSDSFAIGDRIDIAMGPHDAVTQVFEGEVTAVESELTVTAVRRMVVRAYDRSHRLHRGRKTRTFLKQADSAIARKIAGEYGLGATVDTTAAREWVCQANQTDWEFLSELAARHGFELRVRDGKLLFQAPKPVGSPTNVQFGEELISFRARLTAAEQVDKVEVHGWDPKAKKEIVGTATSAAPLSKPGDGRDGGQVASTFGAACVAVTRAHVATVAEASKMATAILSEIADGYVQAEGTILGNPSITVGGQLKVDGVGRRHTGTYRLTAVTHRFGLSGYETDFEVSGRQATDLVALVNRPQSPGMQLWHGIVTNIKDPDRVGRVKVKLPGLDPSVETDWCRVLAPGAGKERGIQFLPEVEDEVLVIGSDLGELFVLGGLWNAGDKLPPNGASHEQAGSVVRRVLQSRTGHAVYFDDSDGAPGITVVDKTGKNQVVIDSKTNAISLKADGDITLEAGGKLVLKAQTDVSMTSGTATKVEAGSNLDLEATANATLKASARAVVNGQAGAVLQGGATADVKAPMVNIGP